MRPLSVKLSGTLIAKLTTIAEQKETTKSAVVRHALERALADRRETRGGVFLGAREGSCGIRLWAIRSFDEVGTSQGVWRVKQYIFLDTGPLIAAFASIRRHGRQVVPTLMPDSF